MILPSSMTLKVRLNVPIGGCTILPALDRIAGSRLNLAKTSPKNYDAIYGFWPRQGRGAEWQLHSKACCGVFADTFCNFRSIDPGLRPIAAITLRW
jgi:hypothetical protein